MEIQLGKEYILVPRPDMAILHGSTFVPTYRLTKNLYVGMMRGSYEMVFVDELVDPDDAS